MKKVLGLFIVGVVIIGIFGAALYFLVPSNVKDTVVDYFDKGDGLFGSKTSPEWGEQVDPLEFYTERAAEIGLEEEKAVESMNKELDKLGLSETAKENVRYSLYQTYGKAWNIKDMKRTVEVFAKRTGESSK